MDKALQHSEVIKEKRVDNGGTRTNRDRCPVSVRQRILGAERVSPRGQRSTRGVETNGAGDIA